MHSQSELASLFGMTTPARLGAGIRRIRKHKKLTQRQLADLAGVSLFCLRDLERAQRSVGLQNVLKVLAALQYSISLHAYEGWPSGSDGPQSSQAP